MNNSNEKTQGLSARSRVVASKDLVSSDLAGEVVILDLKSGAYHGLDEVGARVWQLLQKPATVASLRDAIVGEYDVEAQRCERDIIELLLDLHGNGLVDVDGEPTVQADGCVRA